MHLAWSMTFTLISSDLNHSLQDINCQVGSSHLEYPINRRILEYHEIPSCSVLFPIPHLHDNTNLLDLFMLNVLWVIASSTDTTKDSHLSWTCPWCTWHGRWPLPFSPQMVMLQWPSYPSPIFGKLILAQWFNLGNAPRGRTYLQCWFRRRRCLLGSWKW